MIVLSGSTALKTPLFDRLRLRRDIYMSRSEQKGAFWVPNLKKVRAEKISNFLGSQKNLSKSTNRKN
jgi:hypothetical protein